MDAQECRRWVLALLAWYQAPDSPCPLPFAHDFNHDSGLYLMGADGWISLLRTTARMSDIAVSDLVVDESCSSAAVVFEGSDPVTGFHHRVAWIVRFEDGTLKSLLATTARIAEPGERTRFED